MNRILLTTLIFLLILSFACCVSPPSGMTDGTTAQTTEQATDPAQTESSVTETTVAESDTEPDTTEEITTFGPLHFPEDSNQ